MKRLGFFLFYSPTGKLYDYVTYLLDDMRKSLDKLVIICNGFVSEDTKRRLSAASDICIERPNQGFDFGAWQEGILNVCGLDEVREYDEIVLFNDSFFGPFYSFNKVFADMELREDIDFWGLSSHGAVCTSSGITRPPYIQTYFIVMRKPILVSDAFAQYWSGLVQCDTFSEHVENVASKFTQYFEDLGYAWTVYTPTFDLETSNLSLNMSHHMYNSYEMVANRRFPIIKRKAFLMNRHYFLKYSLGDELRNTLAYIDEHTDYDVRLIWQYLLDNCSLDKLSTTLGLTKVIPMHDVSIRPVTQKRVAVIAHLFYEDLFEESVEYLSHVPSYISVFITTNEEEKRDALLALLSQKSRKDVEVRVVANRGRDVGALLVGCRDVVLSHDYVCYVHDKKSAHNQYYQAGKQFASILMECALHSTDYIESIISLFDTDSSLGMLAPPKPWHAIHFSRIATSYWAICFNATCSVLSRLGLSVPMPRNADCVAVGTVFWVRTSAVRPLFEENWSTADFLDEPLPTDGTLSHGIERSFPFVCQSQGYYTMTVMPENVAQLMQHDMSCMLETVIETIQSNDDLAVESAATYTDYIYSIAEVVKCSIRAKVEDDQKEESNTRECEAAHVTAVCLGKKASLVIAKVKPAFVWLHRRIGRLQATFSHLGSRIKK